MVEEKKDEPSGLVIDQVTGEIEPPLFAREEGAFEEEEGITEKPKIPKGTMPLMPPVIRLAFRVPGELLADRTGFEGWKLSPEDLEDIVEVYQQLGIEAPIWAQALIVPSVCYAERYMAYRIWKKQGKPESEGKGKVIDASGFVPPIEKEK